MIEPNHFIIIVVDGRTTDSDGMKMEDFAKTFADLGCKEAYNLDGGGSAEMYFNGRVVNVPNGTGTERSLTEALYLTK
jgi:exopolysaccharide biosynthesis protein